MERVMKRRRRWRRGEGDRLEESLAITDMFKKVRARA